MPVSPSFSPATHFYDLSPGTGAPFYDAVEPADFPALTLRYRNDRAAQSVGLATLNDSEWLNHFGRFEPLAGAQAGPLALRYHGHQFRHYNRDLGDGRGFLFAQLYDGNGRLLDVGTKGSGQTPYSRSGDGRLTLKGGVREVLATEMLAAQGVYTSKTLSVIETGEALYRGDEPSPARSCVLCRLSHAHVRFGTFQRLAYEKDDAGLERLVDYCLTHLLTDNAAPEGKARIISFFDQVVRRSASLAASWMAAGFVHGVLNTDNMTVTGESFDYGPWRFLPVADPGFTAAYFDQTGLYAYGRQPEAVGWNLAQLGGALARIAPADVLTHSLSRYPDHYEQYAEKAFARRFGLAEFDPTDGTDERPVMALLKWMGKTGAHFEQVFFDWYGAGTPSADQSAAPRASDSPQAQLYARPDFAPIREVLLHGKPLAASTRAHAYFNRPTPVTLLIDEVEALWAPIADNDDWTAFEKKIADIRLMGEALALEATSGF
ncbi:MAG: YdiU family protein [Pseudomonadota bacterium]